MKLLIITSCTGEKSHSPENQLIQKDFELIHDTKAFQQKESVLREYATKAADLYTGQQHIRLMQGVKTFLERMGNAIVDLRILSAGYGLILGDREVVPYECTFAGMGKKKLKEWATHLNVPRDIRSVTEKAYDLCLVLLGDAYLSACELNETVTFASPTILFCGATIAHKIPDLPNLRKVILANRDATRFSCGLIGLKGELAARLLKGLSSGALTISELFDDRTDVLDVLEHLEKTAPKKAKKLVELTANPKVDFVINIPQSWWEKPHKQKIRYFIPEWDDLVDPDYDFETDTHSGGGTSWTNEVYAHQMYPEPNYDGILISKIVAEKNAKKKERINRLNVHRYLRVPQEFPIMGDCGAFGYIMEEVPPYDTPEILDYYTRLGFNYGVSIDHLIVMATGDQRKFRYDLTIHNAEEFIKEHKKLGLPWVPIGAVQGWDPESYAAAAKKYVKMGYKYLALGGLVRSSTPEILKILDKVHPVVPAGVDLHLFGIARSKALIEFNSRGVTSMDSASVLRSAWLGADKNFLTQNGWYSAIRVPPAIGFRAKRLVTEGKLTQDELHRLEQSCLNGLRDYAKGTKPPSDELLDTLVHYDQLVAGDRKKTRERIMRTLEARPWEACGCAICAQWGIQVAIFRGNNRNRRRGFHNTYVFYKLLERIMAGERIPWLHGEDEEDNNQMALFEEG